MTRPLMLGRVCVASLVIVTLALCAPQAAAQGRVQRFTLVAGANDGGDERPRLRYAVADAERFARVLVELGGVSQSDETVLREPTLRDLMDAIDRLAVRVAQAARSARASGGRTEVLFYYSGHADEQGLLLGDDRFSYRTLRDRLDAMPADVRIAVLDACASGAFTRLKSGRKRPPFLVDNASIMSGHAFLTSSAATEGAQESDRIRASYFTHYLVSGFRGAADLTADGKITLNEAYQFAFNETLGRTVGSKGGPQHPSYDINLSGTGDVIMTDLRQTTATLVLDEELDGRFFVRNARKELIVELNKPRGRRVELAVEPGTYEIRLDLPKAALVAKADVQDNARLVIDARQFGPVALERTRLRGDAPPDLRVAGRNRIGFRLGQWGVSDPLTGADDFEGFPGIDYSRYLNEAFSLLVGVQGRNVPGVHLWPQSIQLGTGETFFYGGVDRDPGILLAVPVALRWNPLTHGRAHRAIKPFLSTGLVPTVGWGRERMMNDRTTTVEKYRSWAVSLEFGAGVDVHLTRTFAVSFSAGYSVMAKHFDRPIGASTNYSAPEIGVTIGWLFGAGRTK